MDVLVLIDKLNDLVRNAKQVPLRSEVRVDKERLDDLLNQLRVTIPEELKEARWIVKEREEMLAAAERDAERILGEAHERQTQFVVEHELTAQGELASEDIIDNASFEEREIRLGSETYAEEILGTLEINLSKFFAAVQRGRERLRSCLVAVAAASGLFVCRPAEMAYSPDGAEACCRRLPPARAS